MTREYSYWCDDIEGKVPADLQGTFFRNGPGRINIGQDYFGHWFDGDGMVSAIRFDQGKVHYKNRYVRTPKYVKESLKGHVVFRGFGTMRHGGALGNLLRAPANPANTSVVYHGGKLLALYEGAAPTNWIRKILPPWGNIFTMADWDCRTPSVPMARSIPKPVTTITLELVWPA